MVSFTRKDDFDDIAVANVARRAQQLKNICVLRIVTVEQQSLAQSGIRDGRVGELNAIYFSN